MLTRTTLALALALALALLLSVTAGAPLAGAHEFAAKALRVAHPWVAPADAERGAAVVHMTIANDGDRPDRLVSVATTAGMAESAAIVPGSSEGGSPQDPKAGATVAVPAQGSVLISGEGVRVELRNLGVALTPGLRFPLFLTFASGVQLEVEVWVEEPDVHAAHEHDAH